MNQDENILKMIGSYYEAWYEINSIYSNWAKKHGMQDTTLFILYIITTSPNCTQNHICSKLSLPKQTVSQILNTLERDGHILREANPEDRRNKIVKLTEKGQQYADPVLTELASAEIAAFQRMTKEQRQLIIESFTLLSKALAESLTSQ